MLRRIDLRGRTLSTIGLRELLPRAPIDVDSALASVRPICDDVKKRGAIAVRELTAAVRRRHPRDAAGAGGGVDRCAGRSSTRR